MIKPFCTAVSDYHDFDEVVRHFKNAGIELLFKEVGCGYSELWSGPHGGYHAIFWQLGDVNPTNLIDEWEESFD